MEPLGNAERLEHVRSNQQHRENGGQPRSEQIAGPAGSLVRQVVDEVRVAHPALHAD